MSEAHHQAAVMRWARMQETAHPCLRYLHHVPNGGARSKATAWRLKQEGVKAGVPDLHLPIPRGPFAGLWIEMKNDKPRGRVEPEQREWLEALARARHQVHVAYGWEQAVAFLKDYLALPEAQPA